MTRRCCVSLDLEPDCGGRVDSLDSLARIGEIAALLRRLAIPLTVFVTGRIFDERPEAVRALADLPEVEFGVHAYSHRPDATDHREEIRRGAAAYRAFFGRSPLGYRAPQGRIAPEDVEQLKLEGFAYDSSIFPTWLPGRFNHLGAPRTPYRHPIGLLEIPVTVLHPLPIPFGLGYLRLLGRAGTRAALACARLPEAVVIYLHSHDLIESAHADQLSPLWRWFYRRHVALGAELLETAIRTLAQRGYTLSPMSALLESPAGGAAVRRRPAGCGRSRRPTRPAPLLSHDRGALARRQAVRWARTPC